MNLTGKFKQSSMAQFNEARLDAVRTLVARAPDLAVQSLASLLASDASDDASLRLVRQIVGAEARDRQVRNAAFAPLSILCAPPVGLPRVSFPRDTPLRLWRALKAYDADLADKIARLPARMDGAEETRALLNEFCLGAADALDGRLSPAFASLADYLDQSPRGASRVTLLLRLSPILRHALLRLPDWIENIGGECGAAIRLAFKDASDFGGEASFLYIETLVAAMETPTHILRLINVILDRPSDRYLSGSELGGLGQRLLDLIDEKVQSIQKFDPRRGLEGGVAVASAADQASLMMSEFETQLTLSRESVWGSRIVQQKRALSLAMETRLREVESAIAAVLPVKMIRVNGKPLRGAPNVPAMPDPDAVHKALSLAGMLEGCRTSANLTGFAALRRKIIESQEQWLDIYINDLLDMLRKGEVEPEPARAHLDIAAELMGLVRDPKSAELVRRRAAAA
jgi:hypothetical protein